MWLFSSVNGIPRFSETCRAAMNCPWFLNPSDALSSVIVRPVAGSIGSMPVSFEFKFGFEAIFAAIGLSVVVPGVVDPGGVESDEVITDVGEECFDGLAVVGAKVSDVIF